MEEKMRAHTEGLGNEKQIKKKGKMRSGMRTRKTEEDMQGNKRRN